MPIIITPTSSYRLGTDFEVWFSDIEDFCDESLEHNLHFTPINSTRIKSGNRSFILKWKNFPDEVVKSSFLANDGEYQRFIDLFDDNLYYDLNQEDNPKDYLGLLKRIKLLDFLGLLPGFKPKVTRDFLEWLEISDLNDREIEMVFRWILNKNINVDSNDMIDFIISHHQHLPPTWIQPLTACKVNDWRSVSYIYANIAFNDELSFWLIELIFNCPAGYPAMHQFANWSSNGEKSIPFRIQLKEAILTLDLPNWPIRELQYLIYFTGIVPKKLIDKAGILISDLDDKCIIIDTEDPNLPHVIDRIIRSRFNADYLFDESNPITRTQLSYLKVLSEYVGITLEIGTMRGYSRIFRLESRN